MRALALIVIQGPDKGTRLVLGTGKQLIGRARECDMVLTDTRVSRRHFEAHDDGALVRIDVLAGATPITIASKEAVHGAVAVLDQIVVGDTVLGVVEVTSETVASSPFVTAGVDTLLSGLAADVRGIAALFALVESLDPARNRTAVGSAIASWAPRYVQAARAELFSEEIIGDAGASYATANNEIATRIDPDRATVIEVPVHATSVDRLRFSFEESLGGVSDPVRRLLVLAGRLCGSHLSHLETVDSLRREKESLRSLAVGSALAFLGDSAGAAQLRTLIPRISASDSTVLLQGEAGSGKAFVARLIHEASQRASQPFHVVNCAAIPETSIESELFGHELGAFAGAADVRSGGLETAGRGTLLLEEVGELPLPVQAKLLRALEDKRFARMGSHRSRLLEARVVAATSRDLSEMVAAGSFRSDLYRGLTVVTIRVPSLRERVEDVIVLAEQLLNDLRRTAARRIDGFSPAARDALQGYEWPGNVRELRNAIEHAIVHGQGPQIEPLHLPSRVIAGRLQLVSHVAPPRPGTLE